MSFHGIPGALRAGRGSLWSSVRAHRRPAGGGAGAGPGAVDRELPVPLWQEEWLKPYTDLTVGELPSRGVKRLDVICPASRRIASRPWRRSRCRTGRSFAAAGGEQFEYIPALNSDQAHIRMMVSLICRELA